MHSPYGLELNRTCQDCALRCNGFFCQLSKRSLSVLDGIRYATAYPAGAVLFLEQEPPRGVFVICKGRVKVSMTSSEGKVVTLRIAKPGEVLGLHAVVSGQAYQATAETLEPCQVIFVRTDDFLQFLRDHAEASLSAAQQLSASYQAACHQIRSLGLTHSASERLAQFLLETSADAPDSKRGRRVTIAMTHEEIGRLIGATRETVTRTLGDFKKKQLVVQHGSALFIQNKTAMEKFAGV